jgi:hypothetical protein
MLGSVALTAAGQQKWYCRLFRQPTDKIVPLLTTHHFADADVDIVLYVSYVSVQCRPGSSVLVETI